MSADEREMSRFVKIAIAACVGLVVLVVVVASASPGRSTGDRCPPDRDVMETVSWHGPTYADVREAVQVYVRDHGFELSPSVLRRIHDASTAAIASSTSDDITIDPNLPNTDRVVDLIVNVRRTESGSYEIVGGGFCARVVSGVD